MEFGNLSKAQIKRINPFAGLIIDADIWREAHEYHRNQLKLHVQAFHNAGIVRGLGVKADSPPSLSVTIEPGIAVEPAGNMIVVPQPQRYHFQTRKRGVIYLIIQFREIPVGPLQPPNGGQPTRILEAYSIQECDQFPTEPFLELARIDFDPTMATVKDAASVTSYNKNEIFLSYRIEAKPPQIEKIVTSGVENTGEAKPSIRLGHMVMGNAAKQLHTAGLKSLLREIKYQYNFEVDFEENTPLTNDIDRFDVLYLTGNGRFELAPEKQKILENYLQTGGIILADGCAVGEGEEGIKMAREFGLAINNLAIQFKYRLGTMQRQHPLLSAIHVFTEAPRGAQSATFLEGGPMFYSGNDYGCAWQGGYPNASLPREVIRAAFELGANVLAYARLSKASRRSK
jgi:hypothetical protein